MNSTPESSIQIDQIAYKLESIDEYGFSARVDLPTGVRGKGLLTLGSDQLEVGFRVRENIDGSTRCSFSNLSPLDSKLIQSFLRKRHQGLLEGTPDIRSDEKPAESNSGLRSFTPELESQSNIDGSSPATNASRSQSAESATPASEAPRQKTAAKQEATGGSEIKDGQSESATSIQSGSAKAENSARYIPAVAPRYTPSQTIAPQAVPQAAPNQATAKQATEKPSPVPTPDAPPTVPFKIPESETPVQAPITHRAPAPTAPSSKTPPRQKPVHESTASQTPASKKTAAKAIEPKTPILKTPVHKSVAPQAAAPKALATEPTSTPPLAARRSEVLQPATEAPSLSDRRSNAASIRAARRITSERPKRRSFAIPIIFALTGLSLLAAYFLRSSGPEQSSGFFSSGNSAATENFLPVTVRAEGEVVELLVSKGDTVKKGDLLMRLKNPSMQEKKDQLAAQLTTAEAKINVLKRQLNSNNKKIELASEKLKMDLAVAKSELAAAAKNVDIAKINLDRMQPAFESGAITTLEFEEVRQGLSAAKANKMTAENAVKQIEFAQIAVKNNFLIDGVRLNDDNGQLTSKLEISTAELNEMQTALVAADGQLANLNVTAPRAGTVSVVYRQVGELVKVADETIGLSFKAGSSKSLTDRKSHQTKPDDSSHQNDLNVEGPNASKVAAGM